MAKRETEGEASKQSWKAELIDWLKAFVFSGIIVAIIFGVFIMPAQVHGISMTPTLHEGDRLIAWKFAYEPQDGDTVLLSKRTGLDEALVKRVIAVAGQTVNILPDGTVTVDGEPLTEDYIAEPIKVYSRGDHDYPVTVPEGRIFVMGDNRNYSTDSRFSPVGFVDAKEVIGKVVLRFYPFTAFGGIS